MKGFASYHVISNGSFDTNLLCYRATDRCLSLNDHCVNEPIVLSLFLATSTELCTGKKK